MELTLAKCGHNVPDELAVNGTRGMCLDCINGKSLPWGLDALRDAGFTLDCPPDMRPPPLRGPGSVEDRACAEKIRAGVLSVLRSSGYHDWYADPSREWSPLKDRNTKYEARQGGFQWQALQGILNGDLLGSVQDCERLVGRGRTQLESPEGGVSLLVEAVARLDNED